MNKKYEFKCRKIRGARSTSKAQGLVEFAIVLPVILLTLFVLVELARMLHAWMAIENGARAGVRYAVTAEYDPNHCPPTGCSTKSDEDKARVNSIHDAAWAGSSSIVRVGWDEANPDEKSYFNVIVCDPEKLVAPASTFDTHSCNSGAVPSGEDPGEPGDPVVVVVEFNHPLLSPLLTSIWPQLRLSARRQAKVETYRIPQPVGTAPLYTSPTPRPTNTPAPTNTTQAPPPPVRLCEEYQDLHSHSMRDYGDHMHYVIHEAHGWDAGPAVNQVYLIELEFIQDHHNPETLNVDRFEAEHAPGSRHTFSVDEKQDHVSYSMNVPFTYCYPDHCGDSYRGLWVSVYYDGTLDGEYSFNATVYFPEYDTKCYVGRDLDTRPPQPEPTDTPGPSPTDEPWVPEPTNTPAPIVMTPTNTPVGYEPPPD